MAFLWRAHASELVWGCAPLGSVAWALLPRPTLKGPSFRARLGPRRFCRGLLSSVAQPPRPSLQFLTTCSWTRIHWTRILNHCNYLGASLFVFHRFLMDSLCAIIDVLSFFFGALAVVLIDTTFVCFSKVSQTFLISGCVT